MKIHYGHLNKIAIISIFKSIFSVLIFLVSLIIVVTLSLTYGLIITLIVGFVFVIAFTVTAHIFFIISGGVLGGGTYPVDAVVLLIFFISILLLLVIIILSTIVFLIAPSWLRSKAHQYDQLVLTKQREKISKISKILSDKIQQSPFENIIEVGGFYVGAISTFTKKNLVIDPRIADYLSEEEITAVIAHEYGHFGEGQSFCYTFLRCCYLSSNFISTQINDKSESSVYRKLIRWSLVLVPDFFGIKNILNDVFVHIARIVATFYSISTKLIIKLYRIEFYQSEFLADKLASTITSPNDICGGLVRLSALQLCLSLPRLTPDLFLKRWHAISQKHTTTHPSIEYRLKVIGISNFDSYLNWIKTLMNEDKYSIIRSHADIGCNQDRSLLKLISFSQIIDITE